MALGVTTIMSKDKDLSEIPQDNIKEIQKAIKKGAKDNSVNWANALALADWAFLQCQVHLPAPDMEAAWRQYEEAIAYAVEALSDARGIDGEWRSTYDLMGEGALGTYRVAVDTHDGHHDAFTVRAYTMEEAIIRARSELKQPNERLEVLKESESKTLGTVYYRGVVDLKKRVTITEVL